MFVNRQKQSNQRYIVTYDPYSSYSNCYWLICAMISAIGFLSLIYKSNDNFINAEISGFILASAGLVGIFYYFNLIKNLKLVCYVMEFALIFKVVSLISSLFYESFTAFDLTRVLTWMIILHYTRINRDYLILTKAIKDRCNRYVEERPPCIDCSKKVTGAKITRPD